MSNDEFNKNVERKNQLHHLIKSYVVKINEKYKYDIGNDETKKYGVKTIQKLILNKLNEENNKPNQTSENIQVWSDVKYLFEINNLSVERITRILESI